MIIPTFTMHGYQKIMISAVTLCYFSFTYSEAALEQAQSASYPQQMQSQLKDEVIMISSDFQSRLASITKLLRQDASPEALALACNLNISKLQTKGESLSKNYYIKEQQHNWEKIRLDGNPEQTWPTVIGAWRRLRDWYSKKLLLLEQFRRHYRLKTGIIPSCPCCAQQKKINHAEIAVAVIDVPVDEIALIGTNMVISYGKPVSDEKSLWFIKFCLTANRNKTAIFVAKKDNQTYHWLVPFFIDSNLELALMRKIGKENIAALYQIDETYDEYTYPLPLINDFIEQH